jgi:ComF family protein
MDTKEYIRSLLNIVYPHCCAACGNVLYHNEDILCLDCYDDLPRTQFHLNADNEVARIFWGRIPVINATSFMYFTRESRYRQILHELKYHGNRQIGIEMGKLFGLELRETPFSEIDLIHPVPLHRVKLRQRGYNQSELIALGMSEVMNKPFETNLITRTKRTGTQTKKSRYERWQNVKDTFHIPEPDFFCHKHVLLIDDVITTGATIEACAEALLNVEGTRISIASLACVQLQ